MKTHLDNAVFLHLFSQDQSGLKYLTHDFSAGFDFIDYIYRCQQIVLSYRCNKELSEGLYELVRGFLFGPNWMDYKGSIHSFYMSSEECASFYDSTGKHPLNNPSFATEVEDFRNSIRFRSGRLDLFLREELSKEFPTMEMVIPGRLKGADMYIQTGPIRDALRLIFKGMQEYTDYPRVNISYFEEELQDGFLKSSLSLTQPGSYPSHSLSRDMARLSEGEGGTFGTIKKHLKGLCEWEVVTKWLDSDVPQRWRILGDSTLPEVSPASIAEGFSHTISIYHKP